MMSKWEKNTPLIAVIHHLYNWEGVRLKLVAGGKEESVLYVGISTYLLYIKYTVPKHQ